MSHYANLNQKLKNIFQIDRPDLDFGVYRILNSRHKEISDYLDNKLKQKVETYLAEANSSVAENQLDNLTNEIKDEFGKRAFDEAGNLIDEVAINSLLGQQYIQLSQSADTTLDQSTVFSHLYTFFSRYYDEGDFISQRRYKGDTYAIPYSGEEVMLHWANKDQYYTKSGEMFSNYRIRFAEQGHADKSVIFRLLSADTAKDNQKDNDKDRRFVILTQSKTVTRKDDEGETYEEIINPVELNEAGNELTIWFEYAVMSKSIKQNKLNEQAHGDILADDLVAEIWHELLTTPAPTEKDAKRDLLQKHLDVYTKKNTADYFIHKDLGKFLSYELDFYIKNEVMQLDNIVNSDSFTHIERQLTVIKCLKQIGSELITFLASLEDFQKRLWLKKKFVVSSHYCITLDRVDEGLYSDIIANDAQWQQWEDLGLKVAKDGWQTKAYLQQYPYLMVDTSLFDAGFKAKLINCIKDDDLDEQTDGVIIHGDNFQGLNLLQETYQEKVKCIYIDPPYNTDATPILYKNGFKHSSWIALMNERIELGLNLGSQSCIQFTAIDHAELFNLGKIQDSMFKEQNRIAIIPVQHNPKGRNQAVFFSENCEYMTCYAKDIKSARFNQVAIDKEVLDTFTEEDENGKFRYENFIRARTSWSKKNKPKNWYPLFVSPDLKTVTEEEVEGYHKLYPQTNSGDFSWKVVKDSFKTQNKNNYFKAVDENGKIEIYHKYYEQQVFKNFWSQKKYQSEFNGTNLIKNIMGEASLFSFPKSIYAVSDSIKIVAKKTDLVIDYFAGSGTTAHATIALNREDNGERKYILIEQGEYFNTVLKPRIQKVVYSPDWKAGKPVLPKKNVSDTNPYQGISHCLKVVKLESYEDTLNNLELTRSKAQADMFADMSEQQKNDYLMNYMLTLESQGSLLSVSDFKKPFDYQLKIATDSAGAYSKQTIDLIDTFNYLIGLTVKNIDYQLGRGFVQVTGHLRTGEYTTIIWRDCDKVDYKALDTMLERLSINALDSEYQLIYINGDHNINTKMVTVDGVEKQLKVRSIEQAFLERMFEE